MSHTHSYDYRDRITLACKCGSVIILLVTPRRNILLTLGAQNLLTPQGKAWREVN